MFRLISIRWTKRPVFFLQRYSTKGLNLIQNFKELTLPIKHEKCSNNSEQSRGKYTTSTTNTTSPNFTLVCYFPSLSCLQFFLMIGRNVKCKKIGSIDVSFFRRQYTFYTSEIITTTNFWNFNCFKTVAPSNNSNI